jgi:hypothetical protein
VIIPLIKRRKPDTKKALKAATKSAVMLTTAGAIQYLAARVGPSSPRLSMIWRMIAACGATALFRLDTSLSLILDGWFTSNAIGGLLNGASQLLPLPITITHNGNGSGYPQRYDWMRLFATLWPVAGVMGYVPPGRITEILTPAL